MVGISFLHNKNHELATTLQAVEPKIQCVQSMKDIGIINLTDISWFNDDDNSKNWDLHHDQDALKILWVTNMDFLNWHGQKLAHVLRSVNCCAAGSPYIQSILKECTTTNIHRLDLPVVATETKDSPTLKVVAVLTKYERLDTLYDIFRGLPADVNKGVIDTADYSQYNEIADACSWTLQSTKHAEIYRKVAECAVFVTAARVMPHHTFLRNALATQLWCYALASPLHKGSPVTPFTSSEHGINIIGKKIDELQADFRMNTAASTPPGIGQQLLNIIKSELIS